MKVALGDLVSVPKPADHAPVDDGNSMRKVLEETEREQIVRALEQSNWVISPEHLVPWQRGFWWKRMSPI